MQVHRPRRAAAVLLVLAAVAAGGCSRSPQGGAQADGDAEPSTIGSGTTVGPATTTGGGGPATTAGEPAAALEDGRHPVLIVAVSDTKKTVRFDLVQFLTGDAANKAAAEDGQESPPPNDYYIRNTNPKLRTLPIAPSVTVVVNVLVADDTGDATKDTKITLAKLAGFPPDRVHDALFWLTVSHGKVIRFEEQYIP
jgi:hypothetical protein